MILQQSLGAAEMQRPAPDTCLGEGLAYLPAAPGRLLYWSPVRSELAADLQSLGYQVCVGLTTQLSSVGRQARLGCVPPEDCEFPLAAVWFVELSPEVNALACLQSAVASIMAGGRILLSFSESQYARLPKWREYWITIGARLGLQLLGKTGKILCLIRTEQAPRWQIRLASAQDMPHIQSLFKAVFDQELSEAAWDWKYGQGRGNAILAYRNGELVAHYGAIYRDIWMEGVRNWALQVVDVMVHPGHRGVMTKQGAFFLMTATWDELYGPLAFGFPTARSMQLGQRLGIYADAGSIVELRWPAGTPRPRLTTHLVSVDPTNATHRRKIEELWKGMRQDLIGRVVGERGSDWLMHRFINHPSKRYEILAVSHRLTGTWDGIIVWRESEGRIEILDLIAPLANISNLIAHARRICALRACKDVYLWIAAASTELIPAKSTSLHTTDMRIPTDCWTGVSDASRLIDRWWLVGGDSDFR
ncbi:MAG: GNAT family N-acetyltransferase [Thiomonas sp.]|uniref:GNAT family N-acetyltransferase n=1 Tax=Thiomonas sp. TaxID=2047785 RepID=UPI002A364983|nr:GNAT family N-acetyltransferase [Thiomonas sp.]MDY0330460.1 GNAT family N-acetyltransferase [Thiomonas sp.]